MIRELKVTQIRIAKMKINQVQIGSKVEITAGRKIGGRYEVIGKDNQRVLLAPIGWNGTQSFSLNFISGEVALKPIL